MVWYLIYDRCNELYIDDMAKKFAKDSHKDTQYCWYLYN